MKRPVFAFVLLMVDVFCFPQIYGEVLGKFFHLIFNFIDKLSKKYKETIIRIRFSRRIAEKRF